MPIKSNKSRKCLKINMMKNYYISKVYYCLKKKGSKKVKKKVKEYLQPQTANFRQPR